MAPSHFAKPPQAPPLFTGTPESVIADTKRLIEVSKSLEDKLVKEIKPEDANFKNSILPQAWESNESSLEANILCFYSAVSTDKALRDASTDAEKLFSDFGIESSMREDVFRLVDAAYNAEKGKLDGESWRLLEKDRKGYIRNGLGLPAGPKRDRFKEIKLRLSDLSIQFSKRLNEENGALWFTPEELEGVPKDLVDNFPKGEGEHAGKVKVSFKYPDLFPTLKYAKNAETRKKMFIQNENKCNDNVELFRETILLRDEAARLLGYPNHAAFVIEEKMMKTPKTVDDFLGDLRERLASGGLKEIEVLKALKQKDMESRGDESFDGNYYLWDHRFYDNLMVEQDYQLDQEKIAEYFPLSTAIQGMLTIFEKSFGMAFVEVVGKDRDAISPTGNGTDIVWHKDVQVFSVWDSEDEGGEFIGYLYLDLFPRDGKYGHAANFGLQPGYIQRDGTRRYPATSLVCNFSKPTPKKPSLLKHDEVVTLFHELGHGIHDLVGRTTYSRFHGTNTVRDFVEAPSQMLENWCWSRNELRSLSKHYSYLSPEFKQTYLDSADTKGTTQPPEQIPDELVDSLLKTKHVNANLFNLRQLHFGTFDMAVHEAANHADLEKTDFSSLYNSMRKDISKIDGPEVLGQGNNWGHGLATFGHLLGGYDAGYYGYLSSQVYSTDMFYSVFAKNPMNPSEGRRYRHMVLEKGGSQEEMKTLEEFLGRKPSTEAFYKELGLA